MADDEPYLSRMQRAGISVFPEDQVREFERQRGKPVLGCILVYEVDEDGYVYRVAHHPDLPPEGIEELCRVAAERFVDFSSNAGPGERFTWQKRSDAGYQAWIVGHQLDPDIL